MSAVLSNWELTEEEVLDRIGRFLPPGDAHAQMVDGQFVVDWASCDRPDHVFRVASPESFDHAFHSLIGLCALEFVRHRARNRRPWAVPDGRVTRA